MDIKTPTSAIIPLGHLCQVSSKDLLGLKRLGSVKKKNPCLANIGFTGVIKSIVQLSFLVSAGFAPPFLASSFTLFLWDLT